MTTVAEESHKTRSSFILTVILANVDKLVGPNLLIKRVVFDRNDPTVCVTDRANFQSCNATKLST